MINNLINNFYTLYRRSVVLVFYVYSSRLFGRWWIEAALKGKVPNIPLVNRFPQQQETKIEDIKIEKLVIQEKEIHIPDSISIVQSHELVTDQGITYNYNILKRFFQLFFILASFSLVKNLFLFRIM